MGTVPRDCRVPLLDGRGCCPGRDPVVELRRLLRHELRPVGRERGAPDGRVVPQQAVALAGEEERNTRLRVAVGKLERGALQVQPPVLVLPHAEDTLVVSGLEPRGDAEHVSRDRPQLPALHFHGRKQAPAGSRAPALLQEERAVGIEERDLAAMVNARHDIAVARSIPRLRRR